MGRLVKKADFNLDDFIYYHLANNEQSQDIDKVIMDNQDCLYSGSAYRAFGFFKEEIKEAIDNFLKEINENEINYNNNFHYYANNILDKLINVNGQFQCFSKTLQAAIETGHKLNDGIENIIIKCNISNGLDFDKLVNKHKDNLSQRTLEEYEYMKFEQEVFAKFEDKEFIVGDIGMTKQLFQKVKEG